MKGRSSCDVGTLMQLRNVINRRNIKTKAKDAVNAHEDFLQLIIECHLLAAGMEFFGMQSLEDTPSPEIFPDALTGEERQDVLMSACKALISDCMHLSSFRVQPGTQAGENKECNPPVSKDLDRVNLYAKEVISLGLLYTEFVDAIREGDGLRVLRCWRVFMPIFKSSGRRNYAIEAFVLLAQQQFILSERHSQQLLYSRFINTHGHKGRNISCDLFMEQLNRQLKDGIKALGANKTPTAITRLAKSLEPVSQLLQNFDLEMEVNNPSGMHRRLSTSKDMDLVINELQRGQVFQVVPGRCHNSFKSLDVVNHSLSEKNLKVWMKRQWMRLLAGII